MAEAVKRAGGERAGGEVAVAKWRAAGGLGYNVVLFRKFRRVVNPTVVMHSIHNPAWRLVVGAVTAMLSRAAGAVDARDDEVPIEILRIEPDSGEVATQTVVEIRGIGFPALPEVTFGTERAEVLLAEVDGEIDRLLVWAPAYGRDERVDIAVRDPAHPGPGTISSAADGGGFDYVNHTVIPPVLTGVVENQSDGKAVIGAHVSAAPGAHAAIADPRGTYSVTLAEPGTYTVRAYASGFRSDALVINVAPEQVIVTANLTLRPLESLPDDRDGDGLSDSDEVDVYGTNPDKPDTDTDGIGDGNEVRVGLDPLDFFDGDAFRRSDMDGSGSVDALDLQIVINAALKLAGRYDGDVDRNGRVDARDVQWIVNIAIGTLILD